jgi:hypothetical protein
MPQDNPLQHHGGKALYSHLAGLLAKEIDDFDTRRRLHRLWTFRFRILAISIGTVTAILLGIRIDETL